MNRIADLTHATAHRERRDLVSGEVLDESRLIRFVAGPDGTVTPDLAGKLPGRGLWVAANRISIETAAAKGGFSRAAKTKVSAAPGLADLVERLLAARILAGLGLARRAGTLTSGFEKVRAAIATDKAAWLIEAADGAADGRRKLIGLAERRPDPPRVLAAFGSGELGLALGGENVIHLAFLAGRGAERWTVDVERFSGFRPLLPQSWREEP
ncbi:MAG TPA: RNA-binding protein [Caulobacteraceae bacterium]|nr:RNA-binding protein [Caulobacteraceae bacterium]